MVEPQCISRFEAADFLGRIVQAAFLFGVITMNLRPMHRGLKQWSLHNGSHHFRIGTSDFSIASIFSFVAVSVASIANAFLKFANAFTVSPFASKASP